MKFCKDCKYFNAGTNQCNSPEAEPSRSPVTGEWPEAIEMRDHFGECGKSARWFKEKIKAIEEIKTMTIAPTPLELLDRIWLNADGYEIQRAYMEDLRAFLSRPEVMALADPALGAAAAVVIAKLPKLLKRVIDARDALVQKDSDEAFHQLYWFSMAFAKDPYKPWTELESYAAAQAAKAQKETK